jgi:glycosyltransferase involved in cell wall biosynthesis
VFSLVIPAYNPGPIAESTWAAVARFVAARREPWEAVFVLDGCTDETDRRFARLAAGSDPRLRVVSYPANRGKGYAVRTGLLAARGEYRLFTDVDLAYPFPDVLRVADVLAAGAAVAVGSRTHPESEVTVPARVVGYAYRRHLQSRAFGLVTRTLLPVTQRDTQAGLKGMTAAAAERLVPHLGCDGFGFDCELLTACARAGIAVEEVPVSVRYESNASTTGLRATVRMIRDLWQIRRRWRNKVVPPLQVVHPDPVQLPKAA